MIFCDYCSKFVLAESFFFIFSNQKSGFDFDFDFDNKRADDIYERRWLCFLIECLGDVTGNVTATIGDDKSFKFK